MRTVLTILLFKLTTGYATAQQWPFEIWHEGKIVLESGDTLRGVVKYDLQQDLIQYTNQQNQIEAFTARKVLYFEIFDGMENRYRHFFTLPYAASGNYKTQVFFELLVDGKMTLLTRESLEFRTYTSPYYFGSYTRQVLVYKFFLMDDRANINEFSGKKPDLLRLMGNKADQVDRFMRANRIKMEEPQDFARTINYYNSLF
ncbi:MAG: hypothetical protein KF687_13320 [Cyclobacteriaceae bacterium]|nr:hypothetical protein [Cyclobacteriaceae bacterium]